MYEFELKHKHCGMIITAFGYDFYDACRRSKLEPTLWIEISRDYID